MSSSAQLAPDLDEVGEEILDLWRRYRRTRRRRPFNRATLAQQRRALGRSLRDLRRRVRNAAHFRHCLTDRGLKRSTAYRLMAEAKKAGLPAAEISKTTNKNEPAAFPTETANPNPDRALFSDNFERKKGLWLFHFDARQSWIVRETLATCSTFGHFDALTQFCTAIQRRAEKGKGLLL